MAVMQKVEAHKIGLQCRLFTADSMADSVNMYAQLLNATDVAAAGQYERIRKAHHMGAAQQKSSMHRC